MPNRRQAIIWTKDDIFHWRIYASFGLNELLLHGFGQLRNYSMDQLWSHQVRISVSEFCQTENNEPTMADKSMCECGSHAQCHIDILIRSSSDQYTHYVSSDEISLDINASKIVFCDIPQWVVKISFWNSAPITWNFKLISLIYISINTLLQM